MAKPKMATNQKGKIIMISNKIIQNHDDHHEAPPEFQEIEEKAKPKESPLSTLFTSNPVDLKRAHSKEPAPYDYVLPSLPRGIVGSLVAAGGTGKSMFALQAAYAIAGGSVDFLGGMYQKGRVAYLSFEDGSEAISRRAFAISQQMKGINIRDVEKDVIVADLSTVSVDFMRDDKAVRDVIQFLLLNDCRLCFIDTLVGCHSGDENDNVQMALLIQKFREIASKSKCSVVFLHHMNKQAAFNNKADEQQASRGASSLTDNVRWQAFMTTLSVEDAPLYNVSESDRKLYVRFGLSKVNYGSSGSELWFKRDDSGVLQPIKMYRLPGKTKGGK